VRLPGEPEPRVPRHPFRDSAILYAILSIVVVLFAYFTGGGLVRALLIAAAFFVVATGWSWWRFRERLEQRRGER
jgi:Flp pilus assembly protein TadB